MSSTCQMVCVSDMFKMNFEHEFRDFLMDPTRTEMKFSATIKAEERMFIHTFCKNYEIKIKSIGKEPNCKISLKKKLYDNQFKMPIPVKLSDEIIKQLKQSMKMNPILLKNHEPNANYCEVPKHQFLEPSVPSSSYSNKWIEFRTSLPIWDRRVEIMQLIIQNQVSLLIGDTGSGKSTQVPQFILDYSGSVNKACKVVVCEPRRIAAISLAAHVADERNEELGINIGYQVFLESKMNNNANLIYCTNGILLRWLMNNTTFHLNSITHIIIDEVHERDQFTDLLLIAMKDFLKLFPHLRLILMSATMNTELLSKYFDGAPCMKIPGRLYDVKEYFLENVLDFCKYSTPKMEEYLKQNLHSNAFLKESILTQDSDRSCSKEISNYEHLHSEIDECIDMCFDNGDDKYFFEMIRFIIGNDVSVDYKNQSRSLTVIMAAASHGKLTIVQELLKFGADLNTLSKENYTAFDYALNNKHHECYNFMKKYQESFESELSDTSENSSECSTTSEELQSLLNAYLETRNDNQIDYDLIVELVLKIHLYDHNDAILIFLPGYEEIFLAKNRIINDLRFNARPYQILTLHSQMRIDDQKKVFDCLNEGRKIILSTNVTETSITINELVYVIDCGKVKERYYDVVLCLHVKKLIGHTSSISAYLSKAIEPPPMLSIEKALESLKILGALDDNEQLTDLGNHLMNLTLDPHLGKILIMSTILKCLDPVLTIVASLAYRNPFVLPAHPELKKVAKDTRVRLSCDSFSDHMTFLQVFNEWQEALSENREEEFCKNNFVNQSTLEMISSTRSALLSELRVMGFLNLKHSYDVRFFNSNSYNWPLVKAALATGLYPNIAYFRREKLMFSTKNNNMVTVSTSSIFESLKKKSDNVNNSKILPTDWLIFENLLRNNYNACQIQCCTAITDLIVLVFCGDQMVINDVYHMPDYSELIIDNWLRFLVLKSECELLSYLRSEWKNIIASHLARAYNYSYNDEENFISTLKNVLMCRDNEFQLTQPEKVGNPPKCVAVRNYMQKSKVLFENRTKNTFNSSIPDVLRFPPIPENKNFPNFFSTNINSYIESPRNHEFNRRDIRDFGPNNSINSFNVSKFTWDPRIVKPSLNLSKAIDKFDQNLNNNNTLIINSVPKNYDGFNNANDELVIPFEKNGVDVPYIDDNDQDRFDNRVYLLIKANSVMEIDKGLNKNMWVFTINTEMKIRNYLSKNMDVYLIFFVPNITYLFGLAKLIGDIDLQKNISKSYSIACISQAIVHIEEVFGKFGYEENIFTPSFGLDGFTFDMSFSVYIHNLFGNHLQYSPVTKKTLPIGENRRSILKRRQK